MILSTTTNKFKANYIAERSGAFKLVASGIIMAISGSLSTYFITGVIGSTTIEQTFG